MTEVPSGILVVDKPAGWTSHQVVGRVRRLAGTRKVGHAGTLDPMATGVLVVGIERATRLLGHLALHDKRYLATIRLGQSTVTDDAEGDVTSSPGASSVGEGDVRLLLPDFTGAIEQVPSAVSAIKVDGRRSYARVRAGEEVSLKARSVTVSRFDLVAVRRLETAGSDGATVTVLDVDVDVECSSGTYVRALARDVGERLGVGGHLVALRRTRVGGFDLADVGLTSDAVVSREPVDVTPLTMAEAARRGFPVVELDEDQARQILYGRALDLSLSGLTGLVSRDGELLALYRPDAERAVPETVFVHP